MQNGNKGDFRTTWGYPNEVLDTIKEATSFEVHPAPPKSSGVPATYKSGRPRYMAVFKDASGAILSRRLAMRLTSARTDTEYDVCLRRE